VHAPASARFQLNARDRPEFAKIFTGRKDSALDKPATTMSNVLLERMGTIKVTKRSKGGGVGEVTIIPTKYRKSEDPTHIDLVQPDASGYFTRRAIEKQDFFYADTDHLANFEKFQREAEKLRSTKASESEPHGQLQPESTGYVVPIGPLEGDDGIAGLATKLDATWIGLPEKNLRNSLKAKISAILRKGTQEDSRPAAAREPTPEEIKKAKKALKKRGRRATRVAVKEQIARVAESKCCKRISKTVKILAQSQASRKRRPMSIANLGKVTDNALRKDSIIPFPEIKRILSLTPIDPVQTIKMVIDQFRGVVPTALRLCPELNRRDTEQKILNEQYLRQYLTEGGSWSSEVISLATPINILSERVRPGEGIRLDKTERLSDVAETIRAAQVSKRTNSGKAAPPASTHKTTTSIKF